MINLKILFCHEIVMIEICIEVEIKKKEICIEENVNIESFQIFGKTIEIWLVDILYQK